MKKTFDMFLKPRSAKAWPLLWTSVLLGPLIGCIGFAILLVFRANDFAMLAGITFIVPYAYLIGAPLAFVSALIVLLILRFRNRLSALSVGVLGGFVVNAAFVIFAVFLTHSIDRIPKVSVLDIPISGVFSAFSLSVFATGFIPSVICYLYASNPIDKENRSSQAQ